MHRRNDEAVLRVSCIDEVNKVNEYINNGSYFNDKGKIISPFLVHYDKLGITKDSNKSFNHEVSVLLSKYINSSFKNEDEISCFKNFICMEKSDLDSPEIEEIYDLLLNILNNMSYNSFCDFYESLINKYKMEMLSQTMDKDKLDLLYNCIMETCKKYNYNREMCIDLFNKCMSGDFSYLEKGNSDKLMRIGHFVYNEYFSQNYEEINIANDFFYNMEKEVYPNIEITTEHKI